MLEMGSRQGLATVVLERAQRARSHKRRAELAGIVSLADGEYSFSFVEGVRLRVALTRLGIKSEHGGSETCREGVTLQLLGDETSSVPHKLREGVFVGLGEHDPLVRRLNRTSWIRIRPL